jgi:hypothetical protein
MIQIIRYEYIASITPGIYNSDNIVTAVKTAMEAIGFGGTVTVTFSENTYMLTSIYSQFWVTI